MKKRNLTTRNRQKPTSQAAMGEVRIIGGDWRGRKLPVLMQEGLRPTSDRVRETLFNWLQFEVATARCLDLFSGSGALGLEALSRGAKSCWFAELAPKVAVQLEQNLRTLDALERAQVYQGDTLKWLAQPAAEPFEIVFIDPPFHQGLVQPVIDALFAQGWINQNSWLYIEQEKSLESPQLPEGWQWHREKTTSQVRYGLVHCVKS